MCVPPYYIVDSGSLIKNALLLSTAMIPFGVPRLSLNGNASHIVFPPHTSNPSNDIGDSHFSTPRASQCYNIDQYCINRELFGKNLNFNSNILTNRNSTIALKMATMIFIIPQIYTCKEHAARHEIICIY